MKTFCDSGSLPGSLRLYCYDVPGSILTACQHRFENGLGDRLGQTVNGATTNYTLDLNTGLTQVLSDGQREYLYGRGRIAQQSLTAAEGQREYFLGDALGSVRQLVDANGEVSLARDYQPYGETLSSSGSGTSPYGYTGEMADPSGLIFLRARYYSPATGRFLTRDRWKGDANMPMSYNAWLYAYANPITLTDPSGWLPLPVDPCSRLPYDEREACVEWFKCKSSFPLIKIEVRQVNLSAYYTVLESDYAGDFIPIKANISQKRNGEYLMNDSNQYTDSSKAAQYARSDFLYRKDGLCYQGSGKLLNGRYISCTDPVINIQGFEWHTTIDRVIPLETVAVSLSGPFKIRDIVAIPALKDHMQRFGKDTILKVTDHGGGLTQRPGHLETIDVYIGEGRAAYGDHFLDIMRVDSTTVYIYRFR